MGIKKLAMILKKVAWLLPGFLLWAAFVPLAEKTNVLFALAPMMFYTRLECYSKASTWLWFKNGIVFWVLTLSWMPAIVKNGGPAALVVLGWGALAAYCALYFGLYGWLAGRFWAWAKNGNYWRRLFVIIVAEPLLWAGLEIVRSRVGGGFAWNQLGVVAVNGGFASPAALGGVYLLSAIVVLVNGTLASIAERILAPVLNIDDYWETGRLQRSIETFLPFLLIFAIFSVSPSAERHGDGEEREIRAALVQRNFPCIFSQERENPYNAYGSLVGNFSLLSPDIVILPESAMAEIGAVDSVAAKRFAEWLMGETGARAVVAGGSRRAKGLEFNSAALYTKGAMQVYDKVHLVPFGEYIPLDKTITALQKLAPVGSCTPGELNLLEFDGLKLGVAICYEDTDSAQMRKLAEMGADMLVFITNDSWFSKSDEAWQHAWQAVARAVETGLPVFRVGNSGVTMAVTAAGAVSMLARNERYPAVDERGTMIERAVLSRSRRMTPYVRLGDKPIFISFVLLIAAMVMVKYKTRYEQYRSMPM